MEIATSMGNDACGEDLCSIYAADWTVARQGSEHDDIDDMAAFLALRTCKHDWQEFLEERWNRLDDASANESYYLSQDLEKAGFECMDVEG